MKRKFLDTNTVTFSNLNNNWLKQTVKGSVADTDVETSTEIEEAIKSLFSKSIVLHNDDFNTFDHVIDCLINYCGHQPLQAEQCALIVHNNGKCSVKNGTFDELHPIYEALLENGLTAEIK